MAKVTIEFDLMEEKDEYETYLCAPKLRIALTDIHEEIRNYLKYRDENECEDVLNAINDIILDGVTHSLIY